MTSNLPQFNSINPTADEEADMVSGFLAACARLEKPIITSVAWDYGYQAGREDGIGKVDPDMRILARRQIAKSHGEPDPFPQSA